MNPVAPLSPADLRTVLARLEAGAGQTAAGFRTGMTWVGVLFFGMAILYGAKFGQWGIAAFIAAFGAGILFIGRAAARRTSPERMAPVIAALREAPNTITLVRHYETSDSARMFVSHWLEVKTADHRLVVKANDDWQTLFSALTRHCPQAEHKRK